MKAWVNKDDFDCFKEMQDEGRTIEIKISSYPVLSDDIEIRVIK